MNKKYIIYMLWLISVILWNVLYPGALPIYDIIVAVLLSGMTYFLKKTTLF